MFNDDDILDYIDGELSPEQEQDLFASLSVNPAQRDALRTHRHIEDAVKNSLDNFAPSGAQKDKLFAAIKTQASVQSGALASKRGMWGGLLLLGLISVGSAIVFNNWTSEDQLAHIQPNANSSNSAQYGEQSTSNPYQDLTSAGESDQNSIEQESRVGSEQGIDAQKLKPENVNSGMASAQLPNQASLSAGMTESAQHSAGLSAATRSERVPSRPSLSADNTSVKTPAGSSSVNRAAFDTPADKNQISSVSFISGRNRGTNSAEVYERGRAAESVFESYDYSQSTGDGQEILSDFSLEVMLAQNLNLPVPSIEPANRAATDRLAGALLYHGFEFADLGVELRSETFFQEFEGRNAAGIPVRFEQQPNFVTAGFLTERKLWQSADWQLFTRVTLGGNQVGAVGRLMLGLRFELLERLAMQTGLENSLLWYNHDGLAYQSQKTQLLGMLRYRF